MTYLEALKLIAGLSSPSKMPGTSWSISAFDCQTGGKLQTVEGSVCASCYALKGNYRFSNVKAAHQRRLEAANSPQFVDAFIVVLTNWYKNTRKTRIKNGKEVKENRHRFFDSGDIQSVEMLEKINKIALGCPFMEMWLPTKEAGYVNQFRKKHGEFAPNLIVRLSHPMVGQTFTKKPNGLHFSTVNYDKAKFNCPAYQQGGKCLDCSMCWDKNVEAVNYPIH